MLGFLVTAGAWLLGAAKVAGAGAVAVGAKVGAGAVVAAKVAGATAVKVGASAATAAKFAGATVIKAGATVAKVGATAVVKTAPVVYKTAKYVGSTAVSGATAFFNSPDRTDKIIENAQGVKAIFTGGGGSKYNTLGSYGAVNDPTVYYTEPTYKEGQQYYTDGSSFFEQPSGTVLTGGVEDSGMYQQAQQPANNNLMNQLLIAVIVAYVIKEMK